MAGVAEYRRYNKTARNAEPTDLAMVTRPTELYSGAGIPTGLWHRRGYAIS